MILHPVKSCTCMGFRIALLKKMSSKCHLCFSIGQVTCEISDTPRKCQVNFPYPRLLKSYMTIKISGVQCHMPFNWEMHKNVKFSVILGNFMLEEVREFTTANFFDHYVLRMYCECSYAAFM